VDLDAFVAVHHDDWDRLDALSRRAARRGRFRRGRLSPVEVDELVERYQRAATHLSVVQSAASDPAVIGRLSRTVAQARTAVTGGHEPLLREAARFVAVSFPAAVWRSRWWTAAAAGFTVAVALAAGYWVATSAQAQAAIGAQTDVNRLVNSDFAHYYTQAPAASFAAKVWTNNALIAAVCVAFGITGVLVVNVLYQNAFNIGVVGGLMAVHHRLDLFLGLITPHGLLELTAVFVAAGAGLKLFWAWVEPGPRPRAQALAQEGRAMITVALGLVVVLLVSGVIEAFVTPSPLPTWARIGIGAGAWAAFCGYIGFWGRRAALVGETGDLGADLVEDTAPVAG
jgi:uncharacterized membrane protein SpoIIM required for sporulation